MDDNPGTLTPRIEPRCFTTLRRIPSPANAALTALRHEAALATEWASAIRFRPISSKAQPAITSHAAGTRPRPRVSGNTQYEHRATPSTNDTWRRAMWPATAPCGAVIAHAASVSACHPSCRPAIHGLACSSDSAVHRLHR
ncbi:hypothetical protein GCM10010339_62440 [Streptomyces alanosinicus]|uniref:Uncharacterized protein n=1 Tax=Streptomyces alanosinicus TaxID=68171 RepID=A0A918YNB5_9ACTN|nr:hypothetical protein GCM10010339_62440 [Streptomyces alanosinicus]